MTDAELDQLAINTIRALSIDTVQATNSSHQLVAGQMPCNGC
jgi:transketolase